jgi:hypothetical protein
VVGDGAGRGFVEEEPEQADGADCFGEVGKLYRLADVGVGADAVTGLDVFVLFGGGENDNGDDPGPLVGPYSAQHVEPADLGKVQVEQDESGRCQAIAVACEETLKGLGAVVSHGDGAHDVVLFERPQSQRLVVGIVLDQKDTPVSHAVPFASRVK